MNDEFDTARLVWIERGAIDLRQRCRASWFAGAVNRIDMPDESGVGNCTNQIV